MQPGLIPVICKGCYIKSLNFFFNISSLLEIGTLERNLSDPIPVPLGCWDRLKEWLFYLAMCVIFPISRSVKTIHKDCWGKPDGISVMPGAT